MRQIEQRGAGGAPALWDRSFKGVIVQIPCKKCQLQPTAKLDNVHILQFTQLAKTLGESATKIVCVHVPVMSVSSHVTMTLQHTYNDPRLCRAPMLGRVP